MAEQAGRWRFPWRIFLAELIGTGLLLLVGLSLVVVMFGTEGPGARLIASERLRFILTGFLFGSTGGLIAISPIGRESGAHVNPAVTLAFWLARKLEARVALVYAAAQLTGAVLGSLPLLAWGGLGQSVLYGATVPGPGYTTGTAVAGEIATTFALVSSLCVFIAFRPLRRFTPLMIPFLYAIMVPLEAPISGTSTNPARSFGPAVVSGVWEGWWIYWVGPAIGTVAAMIVCSMLVKRIEVAKLYHFESDRDRLFRRMAGPS